MFNERDRSLFLEDEDEQPYTSIVDENRDNGENAFTGKDEVPHYIPTGAPAVTQPRTFTYAKPMKPLPSTYETGTGADGKPSDKLVFDEGLEFGSVSDKVKNKIQQKRMPLAPPPTSPIPAMNPNIPEPGNDLMGGPEDDILPEFATPMDDPMRSPQGMGDDDFLRAKIQADGIGNMGQALSQASMGVQKPVMNSDLYKNMAYQGAGYLDYDKGRQAIKQKIADNLANRQNALKVAELRGAKGSGKSLEDQKALKASPTYSDLHPKSIKEMTPYQIQKVKDTHNKEFEMRNQPYITSLNSAYNVEHLIEGIKSGALKANESVANTLATDINTMQNQGRSTVSGTDHARIKSLEGWFKNHISWFDGSARDTIPKDQLENFLNEVKIVKKSIQNSFQTRVKSMQTGQDDPMIKEIYQRKFDEYMKGHGLGKYAPKIETILVDGVPKKVQKMPDGSWEEMD